jgi:hypothetical protein
LSRPQDRERDRGSADSIDEERGSRRDITPDKIECARGGERKRDRERERERAIERERERERESERASERERKKNREREGDAVVSDRNQDEKGKGLESLPLTSLVGCGPLFQPRCPAAPHLLCTP